MILLYNSFAILPSMSWEVEPTSEFDSWFADLDPAVQDSIFAAVAVLEDRGPALGRPLVDSVRESRHSNMKELRVRGTIRILFAFDPSRKAILLLGGDKRGRSDWYDKAIPKADRLFDRHLEDK
ncbi:MAG: type II toxin-antitoxin system RelE/ParE family toxin [Solirubrobacterales bacterium]